MSWAGVVADYASANQGPEEHWIALLDGEAVGWIQCAEVRHWPEECVEWRALGADPGCAGIDYLVGDNAPRGKGLGSAMIAAFVEQIVFGRHPEWHQVGADPYESNVASWRALEKAGFRSAGLIQPADGDPDGPAKLMLFDRPLELVLRS